MQGKARLLSSFGCKRDLEPDGQRVCQIILKVSDESLGRDDTSCVRLATFHTTFTRTVTQIHQENSRVKRGYRLWGWC